MKFQTRKYSNFSALNIFCIWLGWDFCPCMLAGLKSQENRILQTESLNQSYTVPEIIDPVFTKTSQNARFLLCENERFGLVFVKTGSINSGTGFVLKEYRIQPHYLIRLAYVLPCNTMQKHPLYFEMEISVFCPHWRLNYLSITVV